MDQYIVSARKYRPTTFEDVVGQRQVAETLMHEINNNKLAQAFLFTGPRGVGKTTCARILAKVINAQDGGDPNHDYAFNIFELDAASNNSVEDIRHLIDQVRIPPQVGRYKVYIIDEVHMLSTAAFNAFLKTLEEPPSYAVFILATTEKHKLLPTILSRCQVFNFNRIETKDMVDHLKGIAQKENIEASEDALHLIARKADGGLRDALSMFDQLVSFGGGEITYESAVDILSVLDLDTFFDITYSLYSSNISDALIRYDLIIKNGFDGSTFLGGMASHFRNLAVSKETKTQILLDVSESFKSKYLDQSTSLSFAFILNGLSLITEAEDRYKMSRNQRLLVELLLMKLGHLNDFIKNIPSLQEVKKKLASHAEITKSSSFKRAPSIVEVKSTVKNSLGNNAPPSPISVELSTIDLVPSENLARDQSTDLVHQAVADVKSASSLKMKGFEQFKKAKLDQLSAESQLDVAPDNAIDEVSVELSKDVYQETQRSEQFSATLDALWAKFYQSQSPRILTCLKSLQYELSANQLLITLNSTNQEGIIDEIRPALMRMFNVEGQHLGVKSLETVIGKLEVQERRPYTDREKLDYLINKHSGLAEALESLNLRLP